MPCCSDVDKSPAKQHRVGPAGAGQGPARAALGSCPLLHQLHLAQGQLQPAGPAAQDLALQGRVSC